NFEREKKAHSGGLFRLLERDDKYTALPATLAHYGAAGPFRRPGREWSGHGILPLSEFPQCGGVGDCAVQEAGSPESGQIRRPATRKKPSRPHDSATVQRTGRAGDAGKHASQRGAVATGLVPQLPSQKIMNVDHLAGDLTVPSLGQRMS